MKKFISFISVVFICFSSFAQAAEGEKKYKLHHTAASLGLSAVNIMDNYLSPLPYSGWGLKLSSEGRQLYSPELTTLSTASRMKLDAGTAVNPAGTASMMFLGLNAAWGMHYHFRPLSNMQILTGALSDIDFGFKTILRNVNNPVNFDLAANLNLSAIIIYDIPARRRTFRLQASFESPGIGCMFAPARGASYYEIFSLGASGRFVHFSSFHNKLALRQHCLVEIPFAHSTWRFGAGGGLMKYKANGMVFKKNDFTIFIGYSRIFTRFTKGSPAPANFIGI